MGAEGVKTPAEVFAEEIRQGVTSIPLSEEFLAANGPPIFEPNNVRIQNNITQAAPPVRAFGAITSLFDALVIISISQQQ